jgi:chemotaxis protein methyltransferase CheR
MPHALSPQVYAILRAHIEEQTGMHFGDADQDLFLAKVAPRAEEAGFDSLLDYYYYLRYDAAGPRELDVLIEHLVVRESYLFRELEQLRMLVSRCLAPRLARGERMRVWCAASAGGEEPLTLAILLAQRDLLDRTDIVATDISQRGLDHGRAGRFYRRALRAIDDPAEHAPWLRPLPDGGVEVDPRLTAHISWRRLNLTDRDAIAALGLFDVILCRNVLIYFSDQTSRRVVESLTGALRDDALMLVSVTESLLRLGTSLTCEEQDGVFIYRKVNR